MAWGPVVAFWLVALLLIVVPGADWAFTISTGLGGNSVLPAVAGLATGYGLLTAIVAAGVGAAVAGSPAALAWLTIVGGLYLIWHGVTTTARPPTLAATRRTSGTTAWPTYARGIGVSGLNPKGLLLFLALLPQFTTPHAAVPVPAQLAVLGALFTTTCAAFYLTLGTLTRTVLTTRPALARATSRLSGAAMIVIGAVLLADHLIP